MGRGRSREVPSTCWGRSHSMQAGSSPSQHAMGAPEASTSGASGPAPPKPAAASSWRPLLRTGAVGFVGGVLLWGVSDVLGEFTTFLKLRERALSLASESQELKDQIGYPFSTGPWYNSSIGFTGGGNIAMATFQLQGTKQITDVAVRGFRGPGYSGKALYNIMGPGAWTIIDCQAMFPAGGGLVKPKSLLPATAAKPGQSHAHAHGQAASTSAEGAAGPGAQGAQAGAPATAAAAAGTVEGAAAAGQASGKKGWFGWGGKSKESAGGSSSSSGAAAASAATGSGTAGQGQG